mgnify:CR=1 FL=1
MSQKYRDYEPQGIYFVTYSVVYWLDLFIRNEYRQVLLDSWKYCQNEKGLIIYSWCIMTNHVHMIVSSQKDPLYRIMKESKSYTSRMFHGMLIANQKNCRKGWMLNLMRHAANRKSGSKNFQFWQPYNHQILLDDADKALQKLEYIHMNPVTAGFVRRPADYLYSSAVDYEGGKGLVDIQKLEI